MQIHYSAYEKHLGLRICYWQSLGKGLNKARGRVTGGAAELARPKLKSPHKGNAMRPEGHEKLPT